MNSETVPTQSTLCLAAVEDQYIEVLMGSRVGNTLQSGVSR